MTAPSLPDLSDQYWQGFATGAEASHGLGCQAVSDHRDQLEEERDRARTIAVALEQECAEKDRRINEALGYLTDALVWCNSDNTGDCIREAVAALTGDAS